MGLKVLNWVKELIKGLSLNKNVDQFKDLFKGRYRNIAITGSAIILILICSLCGLLTNSQKEEIQPTLSITEVAATIYAEFDLKTQIAATIFAQLITDTPEVTVTPEPTINPYQELFYFYPCLPTDAEITTARVVEIVDGDTISVNINDQIFSVRYIGIDCPESDSSDQNSQSISQEAEKKNKELVEGEDIILIKDVSEYDIYNRLLRYVLVGNTFVNYEMVKQGYAYVDEYPPDVSCSSYFTAAQNEANINLLGIWGQASIEHTDTPIIDSSVSCDPSYPTVCISPYPPDLDCDEVPYKRFKVLQPDRHGFDRDGDGIGCES